MEIPSIKSQVSQYYTDKIQTYGPTHLGVDWNSNFSQELRFKQLLKVRNRKGAFSLNDLGCGYGALLKYLNKQHYKVSYRGYDISEAMIHQAKQLFRENDNCSFYCSDTMLKADYTIASGLFNVRMTIDSKDWEKYSLKTLHAMNNASNKGFSFNMLTSYSDKDYMKDYLYYADPCVYFDYCKKNFSKDIAVLHDYSLYEFTIIVRKDS